MFTGIIEEIGTVEKIVKGAQSLTLTIVAEQILEDMRTGDSIAVNGVCLTVTGFTAGRFSADVMPETFRGTSLAGLKYGSRVNLERAMAAGGRFGGHFVTGHVDGTGTIIKKHQQDNALYMTISIPGEFSPYLTGKGSVAVDGTSLTVFGTDDDCFTVALIPHTQKGTVLAEKNIGDSVNVECDMIAKTIWRMAEKEESKGGGITEALLRSSGFLD